MSTLLNDRTLVEYGDFIAELTRGQTVGDIDCGLITCDLIEFFVDLCFRNRVECCRGYSFQNLLKQRKEEYSLLIKKGKEVLGEVVLHNFDYFGGVEVGFRLKREHHGRGYATIAVKALIDYAFETLGAKKVKTRCFKENVSSFNLITRLGFSKESQSDTHYFFSMERE